LLGRAELTALDVARESGVEPDELRRLWQALGFAPVTDDEARFTRADVVAVRAVRSLVDVQQADPGDVLQLTRVIGHAMAAVSDAQVSVVAERLHRRAHEDATLPIEKLHGRIEALAPALELALGYVWRRHLVRAAAQLALAPSAAGLPLVIGFADLVDFTATTQALDPTELASMVERFQAAAHEQVVKRGGRVVKLIGDEVMFAIDDPTRAGEIALALVEAHARRDDLPEIRVGLACGPVLAWEGDFFGPAVNLASRLVNFARPSSVLVSDNLGELYQSEPGFKLRRLRPVKLKGIGKVRFGVLRRQ